MVFNYPSRIFFHLIVWEKILTKICSFYLVSYFEGVFTNVVWVLESATDTHQLSTQVHTHLIDKGGKKNSKDCFWYRIFILIFLQNSKTHLFNYYFFHENCGFFGVSKIPLTTMVL